VTKTKLLMKQVLKVPHFWIILAIMTCGAVFYYADQIPLIRDIVDRAPIGLARYTTHRILSIIPVAYAALVFGFKGGASTAIFVSLALLPRALFASAEHGEVYAEIVAFLFIGLLVSWLIDRQQQAVRRLENTQQELTDSLQTIRQQQQQLISLYAISTMIYRTLDIDEITKNALTNVLEVTASEVGWIYVEDDETDDLVLSAHHGLSLEFVNAAKRIKRGENLDGQVAQSGQPKVIDKVSRELGLRLSGREDMVAILIVPLRSRIAIRGTLGIATGNQQYDTSSKLNLLTALGDEIGIAIGHARLSLKQKVVTEQLQLSEERYRGLFETSSDAIFVCSSAGRIISANRACEQLTGYSNEELQNADIYNLFCAEGLEEVKQLISGKPKEDTQGKDVELGLIRKDGTEAFVELKVSPLLRADFESVGVQAIVRDVTEERRLRQNMQYYITQITRAQEDERLRISRELHDDTAQVLVGLSRGLDSLISGKSKLPKPAIERLDKLHEMADSALEGVRRFSQDLRPSVLDDLGLVPALEWLATDIEKQGGVTTEFSITGNQHRLPPERELAIFRIAQEALSNVRKHSQASTVEMTIDFSDDAVTLIITDNGQGFYVPQRTSDLVLYEKLGIIGMRERARLVGGTLIVQSDIGVGTTVTLRVP
jgi:PAS domain S-box-containing protein